MGFAMLPLVLFSLPASSEKNHKRISTTKTFTIDGQRYYLERSADDDISLILRELRQKGIDIPLSWSGQPANPCLFDALREDARLSPIPKLHFPHGLRAEHVMHMESERGPNALAFGTMDPRGPEIRQRLAASGWKCIEAGHGQEEIAVAALKNGRETFIVFLEEKEGKFLLVHRVE
jgi:hypothetical protein